MSAIRTASAAISADDAALARLCEEISDRLRAGEPVDIDDYARQWPRFASDLQQLLPAIRLMASLHSSPGHPLGSPLPLPLGEGRGEGSSTDPAALTGSTAAGTPSAPATLGDFRLIRPIGRGGMGIVYEAEQISLARRVALKALPWAGLLDERTLTRFKNEARAAASLQHPHIVPVFGSGEEHGVYYYAMQLIRGCTLADFIAERVQGSGFGVQEQTSKFEVQGSSLPDGDGDHAVSTKYSVPGTSHNCATVPDETDIPQFAFRIPQSTSPSSFYRRVAEIGIQVAEALEHAHARGIVHRDIKPSNLLLDESGKAWVTDFGLAAIADAPSLTLTGDLLGTLRYMSPEQAAGAGESLDHRTDIYSLGVTLYELLTAHAPFGPSPPASLLHKVLSADPVPPRQLDHNIPVDLETIVLNAIAKAPADRYSSAQQLADDLQRFLNSQPITARRPSRRVGVSPARPWAIAIATFIAVSLLVLAGLATTKYSVLSTPYLAWNTPSRDDTPFTTHSFPPANLESAIPNLKSEIPNLKSVPAPPGLIAWWSGDGHANDLAGSHHGQLISGATFAPGLVGRAFALDGIDDYILVSNSDTLNPREAFTMEGWIQSNTTVGPRVIAHQYKKRGQGHVFIFKDADTSDRLQFEISGNRQADVVLMNGTRHIQVAQWTHVAASYDGESACLYFNGQLDATSGVHRDNRIARGDGPLMIGAQSGPDPGQFFCGLIDELSFYDRALTAHEISAIYRAGSAGKIKPSTLRVSRP